MVTRVALTLAPVLLLPAGYVSSASGLMFVSGAGVLPDPIVTWSIDVYCDPLLEYASHRDLPGAAACERLVWESLDAGTRFYGRGSQSLRTVRNYFGLN
jgi:hypothetical protein